MDDASPASAVPRPIATRAAPLSEYLDVADLLVRQGALSFRIASDSMVPALRPGALVQLELVRSEQLAPGDLVVVRTGRQLICHRLVRRYEDDEQREWVVTKGDRTTAEDAAVPAAMVVGRVTSVARPPIWRAAAWRVGRLLGRPLDGAAQPDAGPSWRLAAAAQLLRAARMLEFFSLAIPRPEDLVAATRRFYSDPARVAEMALRGTSEGLYAHEQAALDRFAPVPGTALVLGAGGGREAIALAKQGWTVTAIDGAPFLVDAAAASAARAGLRIEFRCQDMSEPLRVGEAFDLICGFGLVYSLVPTRPRRVRMLREWAAHLTAGGVCLVDFAVREKPASRRERRGHAVRRTLAAAIGGNRDCQAGDHWFAGTLCMHAFADAAEVVAEASEAGLTAETLQDGPHSLVVAIRRPSSTS